MAVEKAKAAANKAKEAAAQADTIAKTNEAFAADMNSKAVKEGAAGTPTAAATSAAADKAKIAAFDSRQRAAEAAQASTNATAAAESLAKDSGVSFDQPEKLDVPLFLLSGARFQNPYVISYDNTSTANKATLQKAGSGTVGFLEFAWIGRYALQGDASYTPADTGWFGGHFVNPFRTSPDLDGRVGFVFGNNQPATNYSASTLAGGGDFYATLSVGFPIWRAESSSTRRQVNVECSAGASTDKNFLQVHSSLFIGALYELGYRFPAAPKDPGVFALRGGGALIDNPSIIDGTNPQEVNVDNGLPVFDHRWVPALGVYIAHPLPIGIYLITSANLYSFRGVYGEHAGPDQWNISVGFSIPFAKFSDVFSQKP